jgi:hypothetical protein
MLRAIAICSVLVFAAATPLRAQTMAAHPTVSHTRTSPGLTGAPSAAAGQFASESAARAHCPGDTIVWANLSGSKAYHLSGNKYYGKTKRGAYMCQKEADRTGFHPAGRRAARTTKGTTAKTAK